MDDEDMEVSEDLTDSDSEWEDDDAEDSDSLEDDDAEALEEGDGNREPDELYSDE